MFATVAIIAVACFAAGVAFHKYVINDAEAVKKRVADAESRIRTDIGDFFKRLGVKV